MNIIFNLKEQFFMKKDLGVKPFLFPMPVLMIATYGDNDKVNVMNMVECLEWESQIQHLHNIL